MKIKGKELKILRLVFTLFIDILIDLKILKNTLSSMKFNAEIHHLPSQRKPASNIKSKIILFHEKKKLEFIALKLRNLYSTERYLKQSSSNIF